MKWDSPVIFLRLHRSPPPGFLAYATITKHLQTLRICVYFFLY